eukprot:s1719_g12.t1
MCGLRLIRQWPASHQSDVVKLGGRHSLGHLHRRQHLKSMIQPETVLAISSTTGVAQQLFVTVCSVSPTQATQWAAVPVKIDARELGERLAADAWASADRLLVCLCLRAWRLQRHGRVPVKSPTPPVQFQGAKAPRQGRNWTSAAFIPPRRMEEKSPRAFDFGIRGQMQAWPQRQKDGGSSRLRECFLQWKDEAHSSALVRKKMEEMRLQDAWLGIAKPLPTPFLEIKDDEGEICIAFSQGQRRSHRAASVLIAFIAHGTKDISRGLCDELQSLRKSQVPQSFEVALRNDSEIDSPRPPELRSFNPDTSKMTSQITKIAVFDEEGSPKLHLPLPPGISESSELPNERNAVTPMMSRPSERASQDSNSTWHKTMSRRISVHSTESKNGLNGSRPRRTMTAMEIESDPVQSYSINGIKRKDGQARGRQKFGNSWT